MSIYKSYYWNETTTPTRREIPSCVCLLNDEGNTGLHDGMIHPEAQIVLYHRHSLNTRIVFLLPIKWTESENRLTPMNDIGRLIESWVR